MGLGAAKEGLVWLGLVWFVAIQTEPCAWIVCDSVLDLVLVLEAQPVAIAILSGTYTGA